MCITLTAFNGYLEPLILEKIKETSLQEGNNTFKQKKSMHDKKRSLMFFLGHERLNVEPYLLGHERL